MPKPVGTDKTLNLSAWQDLVESARLAQGLSYRRLGEKAQIPHSTLYQWLCDELGHPGKKFYNPAVNKRLSRALKVDPFALMKAWDESSVAFSVPLQEEHRSRIQELIERIEKSPRKNYKSHEVIDMIQDLFD